jgi:hypothetical protein
MAAKYLFFDPNFGIFVMNSSATALRHSTNQALQANIERAATVKERSVKPP